MLKGIEIEVKFSGEGEQKILKREIENPTLTIKQVVDRIERIFANEEVVNIPGTTDL